MRLTFTELRATYRATSPTPFRLPHHSGSLLRGVLGRALHRASCIAPEPCGDACLHTDHCAYARLFDPPVPEPLPHRFLQGATRAPQPLIPIFPSPGARHIEPGQTLSIGLRLLGPLQLGDADRIHAALEQIPNHPLGPDEGRLEIEAITQIGPRDRLIDVRPGEPAPARIRIRTETPMWIEQRGALLGPEDVDLATIFRHAYRRLTTLAALYGAPGPDDDRVFTELAAIAAEARTVERQLRALRWERWSIEKDIRHPMRGLAGSIIAEGPIGPLLPVLRAAEMVHVGKATSHGLGRIAIDVSDTTA